MKNAYLLVNKSLMLLGIFTNRKMLQAAIDAVKMHGESKIYWVKVEVNTFDSLLPNFWTMHYEKLNEIDLIEVK